MSTETQKPQNPETPAGTDAETSKTESSEIHFRDLFLPPEILKAVEELGYELVDVRWSGSGQRPVLRVRIDRSDSTPKNGVNVGDCAVVSRALESWLDEHEALSRRYVLEVH